ncbi:MAG: alkaline phosphatase family protein [Candidatus Obscuribacterales bacterium]|nr:alkaline phosphatase family protein [Candidatus Obscuribacterales bacterium]
MFVRKFASALCLLVLLLTPILEQPVAAQLPLSAQPKLILFLVVDQFSFDYLNRFNERFGAGGFRYLMDNGANFTNCRYKHATTHTAVGHSIMSTGAYPWSTGVVANTWYSKRKEKEIEAVEDDTVQLVGGNGPGASCRSMAGSSLGDEMRLATNGKSKVFTCSLKDRAALFLAGRMANGAYWFDTRTGHFVSSSQFGSTMPGWVNAFNDRRVADSSFGKPWQRLLPENLYNASTKDDYTYERAIPGDGRVFPHVISGGASSPSEPFYQAFRMTPFSNQMLADFAKEAIEKENLGARDATDMLGISFSASDFLGHSFGPNSQEIEDLFLRLDQTLASFFQYLDQKIGLDKCMVVLCSDHGCMPIPEFLRDKGLDAGRIDSKAMMSLMEAGLDQKLGADDWIASFQPPNLYFNRNTISKQKVRKQDVEDIAAQTAESVPGVGDVYTAFQFYMNQMPPSPHLDFAKRSYFTSRSGDLFILPKPGYIFSSEPNGTGHGSQFRYDSQVPLIIMGPGIKAGKYTQDCSPADIAPTLCSILHINVPSLCEGRALSEAISQIAGPARPLGLVSQPAQ